MRADEENPRGRAFEGHDDPVLSAQVLHAQPGQRRFVNEVDGEFVGELCDPVPVTADPMWGLVPRVRDLVGAGERHPA